MKYTFIVVSLMLLVTELSGQWMIPMNEDSLLTVLKNAKDTTAVRVLQQLAGSYFFKQPATSLAHAKAGIDSSRRLKYNLGIIECSIYGGEASRIVGDLIGALKMQYEANQLSREAGHKDFEANSAGGMGMTYFELQHFEQSLKHLKRAVALRKTLPPDSHEALYNVYIARDYIETKKYDSAYHYLKEAAQYLRFGPGPTMTVRWRMVYHGTFGDYYFHTGRTDSAYFHWKTALKIATDNQYIVFSHISLTATKLSSIFSLRNQLDSSLHFARLAFKVATDGKFNPRIRDASRQLADVFQKMGNADSALYYQGMAITLNDRILGSGKMIELQLLQLEEQKRNLEIQQAEERYRKNIQLIGLISITAIILVASASLFRSNRIKQKTNIVLQQTLNELKATQSQLVQSEKMASLGELTAGIAHEIQNPLNFVNNFAEVNKELIRDLKSEITNGNLDEVSTLATDIEANEEKINFHGKRADAIVKSMLQHSRISSGKKELTNLNALCDEYLRLSYHGLRAKDKSFNAKFETHFDPSLPKVNVVSQEIGRVMLNLINNAFYAINQKAKLQIADYQPQVTVSTKTLSDKIEIRVQDNGNGIPDGIREKVFQPFFTTKPTGQGTGLGLSLSYDIITKSHGGELKVETKENEGTTFIVTLKK
jgi:signal transduction histidine kinase